MCHQLVMLSKMSPVRKIWLGREYEVGELEAGLDELSGGHGRLFLITGEPGIGKTRMADELSLMAAARGVSVHWGRAWEAGGAPPYWPFIQVLRSVCRGLDADALGALAGAHGTALLELMPELRQAIPGLASWRARGTTDRFELFDGVNSFLHAVAAKAPQLVVLDDLHVADPSSLLLLQFLERDLRSGALLVVGTYRDAEARLAPDVGRTLTLLAREATVLPLRRLSQREVADFVTQATGAAPSVDQVDVIQRRTEGNPLFLRELLRLPGTSARQPEGIREVVRARLALLTPDVRLILGAAAVLGREFAFDPLVEIVRAPDGKTLAAETSEPDVRALLQRAADAGIVEPLEQSAHWRFTHVLLREGLYEELPAARRAAIHLAAARELGGRIGGPPLAELAHHLLLAVPAAGVGEAADAALLAAERAMDVLAFEDACALLERAAKLVEGVAGEERRFFEVLLGLGLGRIRSADITLGKEICLRAATLARRLGDGDLFARAVLGSTYEFTPGVRDVALIALLEEALAALPSGDGALRARCMAQLAAERQPEPDTQGPIELARAAVAMARRVGDADTLRFALAIAGLAMVAYAEPAEQVACCQEALRLATAAGDKLVALRANLFLAGAWLQQGNVAQFRAHARAHDALALEFRHSRLRWTSALLRAAAALWDGRFEEAERWHHEADAVSREDATRGVSLLAFPVGFCRAAERYGDLPGMEARLRASFESMREDLVSCVGEMLIAQLYGRAGDRQRTTTLLAAIRTHPLFREIKEPSWLALLVEPCHLLRDVALAEQLYSALLPRAHQFFFLGPLGGYFDPPHSRDLGLLCEALGRVDEAVAHLADAESRMQVGPRSHLARVRYELAGVLLARDGPGDGTRAAALLEQARALAEELDQSSLMLLISARVAESSPHVRHEAERPAPGGENDEAPFSLHREGDYWTIAWGVRTLRLREGRGLQMLATLIASPGQEFHVLQLVSSGDEVADAGDAGTVLDEQAVQSYRRRLLELREELDEAEGFADAGRANRAREEIDFLTDGAGACCRPRRAPPPSRCRGRASAHHGAKAATRRHSAHRRRPSRTRPAP